MIEKRIEVSTKVFLKLYKFFIVHQYIVINIIFKRLYRRSVIKKRVFSMKMDTYLRGRGQIIFPGILAAKVLPPASCSGWVVILGGLLFSHKIDFLTFVKEEKISGNF